MAAPDFNQMLMQSAAEVLESMCFTGVSGNLEAPTFFDPHWVAVKLHFSGQPSGYFGLCSPLSTSRTLASNFLGEDDASINDARAMEVLCELSNMMCGSFLSQMGSSNVFDLSQPESDPVPAAESTARQSLQLDDGHICVWMNLENPHEC
jgi:chemotaxis protein CheY-P-specific phosphatase CheC